MANYLITGATNSWGEVGGVGANGVITFGNQAASNRQSAGRFTSVNLAQGTVVNSAKIYFYVESVGIGSGNIKGIVYGINEDNTSSFTSSPMARSRTSTSVGIDTAFSVGNYFSVDVTAIVNEILGRAGWVSGNSLGLMVFNNGSPLDVYMRDTVINSYLSIELFSSSASSSSSQSASGSASDSPSPSGSMSPSASQSRSPSASVSPSKSQSPSSSSSSSLSPSGSSSSSVSPSASNSASLSPSGSNSPSHSSSPSASASGSLSPSASISPSKSASNSPSQADNVLSIDLVEICFKTDFTDEYEAQSTTYPENLYVPQSTRFPANDYTTQNTVFIDNYEVCD